jgi:hypothetical protein
MTQRLETTRPLQVGVAEARCAGKGWEEGTGRRTRSSEDRQGVSPRGFVCCVDDSGPWQWKPLKVFK